MHFGTQTTVAFIEFDPQIGFQNTKVESSFLIPFLIGAIAGIIFSKWFL